MNVIEALSSRVSNARLTSPAPTNDQLQQLFLAASRAADHGLLSPYRFLVVTGESSLQALGKLYRDASSQSNDNLSASQLDRIEQLPFRAPMVVVAIACCQNHPKVPIFEQKMTAAAAVQNMINAAYALNIGAYWRTGDIAYNAFVERGLGLDEHESIVGFIYLGAPAAQARTLRSQDTQVNYSAWP